MIYLVCDVASYINFFREPSTYFIPLLIASIPFMLIVVNNRGILLGLEKIREYSLLIIVNPFLTLVLCALILLLLKSDLNGAIFGWFLATLFTAFVSIYCEARI